MISTNPVLLYYNTTVHNVEYIISKLTKNKACTGLEACVWMKKCQRPAPAAFKADVTWNLTKNLLIVLELWLSF